MEVTTTPELMRRIIEDAQLLADAFKQNDQERACELARRVLSMTAKVHQRLGVLVDMSREARWMAEVDRAVRAAKPELPGQLSIDDAPPPSPRRRSPRKGKS